MALNSYSALQTAVATWLNRDDLTAVIPDFIALCEARIRRTIKTRHTSVIQASLAADDSSVDLPDNVSEVLSVSISDSTLGSRLEVLPYNELVEWRRLYPTAGIPTRYSLVDGEIELAPTSDGAYTINVEIEGPFEALSNSNTTNWILDSYPDVYLYGTLAESAPFLKDDERIIVWDGRFQKAMDELDKARDRWKYSGPVSVPVPRIFS